MLFDLPPILGLAPLILYIISSAATNYLRRSQQFLPMPRMRTGAI